MHCLKCFPKFGLGVLKIATEIISEIGHFASSARAGAQLDAPLDYDRYICVARTLDADQIFWRNLLPKKASGESVAFVLESRLGAVSCGVAAHFDRVVAWHRSADAARLTQQYAADHKLSNIRIVVAEDIGDVDLGGESFDAVIIFGPSRDLTAQWSVGVGSLPTSTLERLKDALSEDAVIVIAENNRWAYRPETPKHSGMGRRSGMALPTLKSQVQKQFPHTDVYVCGYFLTSSQQPLPDFLKHDLPPNRSMISNNRVAAMKGKLLNHSTMRLFWPAFLMISAKRKQHPVAHELMHQKQVALSMGWQPSERVIIKRVIAGNSGTSVLIGGPANRDTADVVLRLPSRRANIQRCHINATALVRLQDSPLSGLLPRLVCQGNYHGQEYTVETRCTGVEIAYGTNDLNAMVYRACTAIEKLHVDTTVLTVINAEIFDFLVTPYIADIHSFSSPDIQIRLDKFAAALRHALIGKTVALGAVHGDFKVSNMLFDGTGKLTALIDWDGFSARGFQVFDYLTLLAYKIANEQRTGLAEAYLEYILPWTLQSKDAALVNGQIVQVMADDDSFLLVRVVFWFALLGDRLDPVYKRHAQWHRLYVLSVLPTLESIVYGSRMAQKN